MVHKRHPIRRVAVIGAGAAGLTALKALREEGLDPVAFEQSPEVGGVWSYDESAPGGGGPAYRSLTTNTSARMMAFSDFPLPHDLPDFPARSDVLQYLNDYADYFDLRPCIRFNTPVEKIEPTDDNRWALHLQSGSGLPQIFDAVVVASGFYREPRWPSLPGLDAFRGRVLHSSAIKDRNISRGSASSSSARAAAGRTSPPKSARPPPTWSWRPDPACGSRPFIYAAARPITA